MATDLLARLAAEARPVRARRTPQFPLDPFSTGPVPARPPRPTVQQLVLTGSGATRCAGTTGRAAHRASAPPSLFPAEPAAPFPFGRGDADAPAGLVPGEPAADTARSGHSRRSGVRVPLYAAVSATVITATAAVAASAGPVVITPASGSPDLKTPSAAAAGTAALSLTLPTADPIPVTPGTLGGPAALLAPDGAIAQGSAIVANAKADAKALGAHQPSTPQQSTLQAPLGVAVAIGGIPAHIPPNTGPAQPTYKPKPKPAAAPAPKTTVAPVGSSLSARALALAKGKLGDPYVWGAAGPNAFDCSGLVVWAFKQLGKALPHSSATLSTMGTPVAKAALQPGDLVFFYSPVSHVGIYAGKGMVLNATESGQPVQYTKLANLPFHNARRITV